MNNLVRKAMREFKGSFINNNNELILAPGTNLYIILDDVQSDLDVKCKLLEWCSRDACKSMPYSQKWRNDKYNNKILQNINKVLETSFTHYEMEFIYQYLGNGIHRSLTIEFIDSDYDMKVFEDNKQ